MKRALAFAAALLATTRANAQPIEEVQVRGDRALKASKTTVTDGELRTMPGVFGDQFRVLETMPGVTPILSGLPFFFVRGAPPGNNGYYLDGIRVPLLYHIGFGPSVIHPGLVSKVDFFPGGPPARFGRSVGGVLSAETRPEADALHGEGNIRLFDAGALVETPFADGRGTVLAAGRYSYTGALITIAAPGVKLDYWDYQGRASYAVTDSDTISVFAFGGHDFLGQRRSVDLIGGKADEGGKIETVFETQFHRLDLRLDHRLPNRGRLRIAATVGSDETATQDVQGVRDRMIGTRLYFEQPLSRDILLRAGTDAILDHYDLAPSEGVQTESALYPPRNDIAIGLHVDAVIRPHPRWEVVPGLRVDYFGSVRSGADMPTAEQTTLLTNAAKPSVDPRLLSRLELSRRAALISTFAVTHQTPSFFIPVPGLQIGRLAQGLQTGVQTSQGLELRLPFALTVTPTLFHHTYLGLNDFLATCGVITDAADTSCVDKRVRGRTIGFELLVRRAFSQRLTGWVSYTLSRSTRETEVALFGNRVQQTEMPADFDRTHVLNVIGAYDLGAGWRAGGRFYFYTGRPYSNRAFDFPVPPFNNQRMPDFYRFDARVEKQWRVGSSGRVSLVLEWLNFTFQKEVTSVTCKTPPNRPRTPANISAGARGDLPTDLLDTCTFDEVGPITIPSIGIEGAF